MAMVGLQIQWSPDNLHTIYTKNLCKLTKHANYQIHCLHGGCLEGKPAVYTLIQFTLLLVEKAGGPAK